jgi:hypothetical protein
MIQTLYLLVNALYLQDKHNVDIGDLEYYIFFDIQEHRSKKDMIITLNALKDNMTDVTAMWVVDICISTINAIQE